ncbi:Elongation of fatty acids protein 2 [Tulasnella sp. JGI-2019a]|nr:Elongation of fatty acids protein 2 [Tulasnella sp. JGI-2019a]
MGIKGLTALLLENAPQAINEHEIKTLFGRKVAIDASMSIYQFLIAVRSKDGEVLTNEAGETTSHLMGFFYRTIRMVENGIKPAYVFDGKPPELKSGVLAKRFERRKEATEQGEEAKEVGTTEDVDRLSRRTVRVTKEHNEECRRLLKLMGIPVIVAPSEAEAQCAELARGGKVYAAGSEDMDTLTFHSPIIYRHLTFSEAKKAPIQEISLAKALEGLEMDMSQFVDLCILLGCDYLEPIKGVGPKSALKLVRENGSLAKVLKHLKEKQKEREELNEKMAKKEKKVKEEDTDEEVDAAESENDDSDDEKPPKKKVKKSATRIADSDESDADEPVKSEPASDNEDEKQAGSDDQEDGESKPSASKAKGKGRAKANAKPLAVKAKKGGISVPEYWPWEEAKELFMKPDVTPADDLELIWEAPDVEGLVEFLVKEKGFNEDRVRKGAEKLTKMQNAKQQGRLDGFFSVKPKEKSSPIKPPAKGAGKGAGSKRKADDKKDAGGTSKKTKAGRK